MDERLSGENTKHAKTMKTQNNTAVLGNMDDQLANVFSDKAEQRQHD